MPRCTSELGEFSYPQLFGHHTPTCSPSWSLAVVARLRTRISRNFMKIKMPPRAVAFSEVQGSSVFKHFGCPPGIRTPIERVRVASPTIEREGNTGCGLAAGSGENHNRLTY